MSPQASISCAWVTARNFSSSVSVAAKRSPSAYLPSCCFIFLLMSSHRFMTSSVWSLAVVSSATNWPSRQASPEREISTRIVPPLAVAAYCCAPYTGAAATACRCERTSRRDSIWGEL